MTYHSPAGTLNLASQGRRLAFCWWEGQKHVPRIEARGGDLSASGVLLQAKEWLNCYFCGQELPPMPEMELRGSAFQLEVWRLLQEIPYGRTVTYGEMAAEIAERRGMPRMSAQAVGGAVGHNPIAVFIPCHRVVGVRSIGGYAAGVGVKRRLLEIEGAANVQSFPLSSR